MSKTEGQAAANLSESDDAISPQPGAILAGIGYRALSAPIEVASRLLVNVMSGRGLGPARYGLVALAGAAVGFVHMLVDLGTTVSATRAAAQYEARGETGRISALYRVLRTHRMIVGSAGAIGLALAAGWLARAIFHQDTLLGPIQAYSPSVLLGSVSVVILAVFAGLQRWDYYFYVSLTQSISVVALVYLFLRLGWGVSGVCLALALSSGATWLTAELSARRIPTLGERDASRRLMCSEFLSALKFGLPLAAGAAGYFVLSWFDTVFLGMIRDIHELSYYRASLAISSTIMVVPNLLRAVLFPAVTAGYASAGTESARKSFSLLLKYFAVTLVPLGVGIALLPQQLLGGVYGTEYAQGAPALSVLGPVLAARGMSVVIYLSLVAGLGRSDYQGIIMGLGMATSVGLNLLLIPRYGAIGAALAMGGTQVVGWCSSLTLLHRCTGCTLRWFPWAALGKVLLAVSIVGAAVALLRDIAGIDSLLTTIAAGSCAYAAYASLLWLLRFVTPEESALMRRGLDQTAFGQWLKQLRAARGV